MRPSTLLLCLALAGCAAANAAHDVVPSGPGSAPAEPDNKQWWQDGPMTKEKASSMCWMKTEKGRNDIALDKRVDLVDKCIADTLKGNPVR